jgi:predicted permease
VTGAGTSDPHGPSTPGMESILADLRYSARSLLKRPGFTALAVLTLALGIGVTTVAFSAISALLLRPFFVADADHLGWITLTGPGNPRGYATSDEFEALARDPRAFEAIEAEARVPVSYRTRDGVEQAWALLVSTHYLRTFHLPLEQGRAFDDSDIRRGDFPVVVSHRFWSDKLGAPASLGGLTIEVGGRLFSVIGVVEDAFQGPGGLFAPDLWIPLARMDMLRVERHKPEDRWLTLFGRIRDGVTYAQGSAELTAFAQRMATDLEQAKQRRGVFYPMKDGHPDLREIRPVAWLAFGAVNIVLLIACFNLSSLLIARSAERQTEIGVRTALGASRRRIVQQLLTESLLVAVAAGIAALIVASWSGNLLAAFSLPAPIPQRAHLGVNRLVILFAVAATLVAGVLPALLPAIRATRDGMVRSIRTESGFGSRSRVRSIFVVAQIAGSTTFVVAAALFGRSFLETTAVDPGFDADHIALIQISPSEHAYTPGQGAQLVATLRDRIASLPGVAHASMADRVPFYVGATRTLEYAIDGTDCRASECQTAGAYGVGPGYFAAMGVAIREGRDFSAADLAGPPSIVISEHMAHKLWPGESALGRTLRLGDAGERVAVIGVAANMRHRSLSEPDAAYVYRPLTAAAADAGVALIARTANDPRTILAAVREVLRSTDPDIPPSALTTMNERMQLPLWPARTTAGFFAICGTLALALASIGLFGVMYFTVAQRTREFGIRVAIGATRARVLGVVLGEGLRLAIPGVVVGIGFGYLAGRLLARALYGISPADPVSLAATAALQIFVALAACALPAYRATTADPIAALRQE